MILRENILNLDETPTGELIALDDFDTKNGSKSTNLATVSNTNPFLQNLDLNNSGNNNDINETLIKAEDETDLFGFDVTQLQNHRVSLANSGSLFSANDMNLMDHITPLDSPLRSQKK